MVKNIIWDVDGTLFDTYPAIAGAFREALRSMGEDAAPDRILALTKQSLAHCLTTLAAEHHLKEEALGRAFDERYGKANFADQPTFAGVKAVCEYILSIGGRNVIVTHRGHRGTVGLLEAHGLTPFFTGWITHEDGHPRKPDPAAFLAAMEVHGLQPGETLTVGDREIDIQAGRAAGIRTCLFRGEDPRTEADLAIREFDELLQYLRK
ncbi:MAG: HAD-IA family hydrolase [Anaerolineales bacterium]|nr:HAD-IA family hydrolase [Anaerolineales bacterium]